MNVYCRECRDLVHDDKDVPIRALERPDVVEVTLKCGHTAWLMMAWCDERVITESDRGLLQSLNISE